MRQHSFSAAAIVICAMLAVTSWVSASTAYLAKSSATPLDLTLASTWTTGIVPTSTTVAQFTNISPATEYFLSKDFTSGNWAASGNINVTMNLGADKTWNVVSSANANGSGIGWIDSGISYAATVTLTSGTMNFSGTDPILIGYSAKDRVAGTVEHNFIIDGGTVNFNSTSSTGTSNAGCLTINRSGMLWIKPGSTLNAASTTRIRVATDIGWPAYMGLLRVDGTLTTAGKLPIGDYRPGGTLQVGGTINLTGTGTQLGGAALGNGIFVGAKLLLTGTGSIIATNHQALTSNNSTGGDGLNPGMLMGNGVIDNVDVTFNAATAGRFKIAPGVDAATTGTIELRNASLTESNGQIVALKIGGTSADKLLISTAGKSATIANGIKYSALPDITSAAGVYNLVVAPTITYGTTALSIGSEAPTVVGDNLVALLNGLGYTRITGTAPSAAGQFRYYVGDAGNGLKALRVEFAPEPVTLAMLGLGSLSLLRRRKF